MAGHSVHWTLLSPCRPACLWLLNRLAEPLPPHPLRPIPLPAPGPVNPKGLPANLFFPHVTPEPAVEALIAVVSHHKVGPVRNGHRPEVITGIDGAVDDAGVDAL